jgi:hypothetical protein
VRSTIGVVNFTNNKLVVTTTERIIEKSSGLDQKIRVVAISLGSRRTIIVPFRQLVGRGGDEINGSGLGSQRVVTTNPDVFNLDLATLFKRKVFAKKSRVGYNSHFVCVNVKKL